MADINQKLNILYAKLQGLAKQQEDFSIEISQIKKEIIDLKKEADSKEQPIFEAKAVVEVLPVEEEKLPKETPIYSIPEKIEQPIKAKPQLSDGGFNLEKFIGENLANKIGVVILILGVAIGTKYSIDHNLVTPLTRIIIGYILSALLFGFGIKLKKKFLNLSAVLVSGSMASFYLVSFAAFAFFKFYPQWLALLLLVLSTIGGVFIGISYQRQIIAQIGLVGAYAAPFLVSTGSNNVFFLFTYIAIINLAVLFLAQRQNWKELSYSSFFFTWLIFLAWFLSDRQNVDFDYLSLVFSSIFYLCFHVYYVYNRWKNKSELHVLEVLFLIFNSLFVYLAWFDVLESKSTLNDYTGLFLFTFAALNALSAYFLFKKDAKETTTLYLLIGFSVLLTIIGIAVQFKGNWVPILDITFAASLLFLARRWKTDLIEIFFYPVVAIALIFFISNLTTNYKFNLWISHKHWFDSVFNYNFLTSLSFSAILAGIVYYNAKNKYDLTNKINLEFSNAALYLLPSAFFGSIYMMVNMEIGYFWDFRHVHSTIQADGLRDYMTDNFNIMWQLNWSLLLISLISIINFRFYKNINVTKINLFVGAIIVILFLTKGLYTLSEIREAYIDGSESTYVNSIWGHSLLRYVSLSFLALLVGFVFFLWKKNWYQKNLIIPIEIALHIILFWVACSQLLHWMDFAGMASAYKTGLSVMGGAYALFLVGLGIWKNKTHLRIMAIVLFGLTLVKLFFYDITNMSMISKTIVFIILGILLLIISYLYNKYNSKIEQKDD